MTGHSGKRRGSDETELTRWLESAKTELPEPSPAFRAAVMANIRARPQRPAAWWDAPLPSAWRIAMPTALALLLVAAFYMGMGAMHAPPQTASGHIAVRFTLHDQRAGEVRLAGDFTQWEPRHALRRDSRGVWTAEIPLTPGRHEYMFVIDGKRWVTDPGARQIQDDGYGGKNSVIVVTAGDRRKEHSHVEAI